MERLRRVVANHQLLAAELMAVTVVIAGFAGGLAVLQAAGLGILVVALPARIAQLFDHWHARMRRP